jgi:hypothetical protein
MDHLDEMCRAWEQIYVGIHFPAVDAGLYVPGLLEVPMPPFGAAYEMATLRRSGHSSRQLLPRGHRTPGRSLCWFIFSGRVVVRAFAIR